MAKSFDVEAVDLADLARGLHKLRAEALVGEVAGRTAVRDTVVELLGCSQLEAENLVETMISRGFIQRRVDERSDGVVEWQIRNQTG